MKASHIHWIDLHICKTIGVVESEVLRPMWCHSRVRGGSVPSHSRGRITDDTDDCVAAHIRRQWQHFGGSWWQQWQEETTAVWHEKAAVYLQLAPSPSVAPVAPVVLM